MATIDICKDIINEVMDVDPSQVTADSTFESLHVDSLDMVEMICNLEDRMGIDFGEPEGLTTVGELVAYVDGLAK